MSSWDLALDQIAPWPLCTDTFAVILITSKDDCDRYIIVVRLMKFWSQILPVYSLSV